MRRLLLPLAVIAAALTVPAVSSAAPSSDAQMYIVEFRPNVNAASQASIARGLGFDIAIQYKEAINGFAARMSIGQANALSKNPNVKTIEVDGIVTATAASTSPSWGLDRIDQALLPLSTTYAYPDNAGQGVDAYVIDTGILATHPQFGTRVASSRGFTAINDGRGTSDCNGHGTHVAGTIGGSTFGVANKVTLIPIRVLDCNGSGTNSGVIAGIDKVVELHVSAKAVANMSLGGGYSTALNSAVDRLINDGVVIAVAAGNSNADACSSSPSSVPNALTVAASDPNDFRASFSNYGKCVDLFAPGVNITSSWIGASGVNTISGTSMASPHVAGVAALLLSSSSVTYTNTGNFVTSFANSLINLSVQNLITGASGSPNNLLQISSTASITTATSPAPAVNATVNKTKANVSWSYPNGTGGSYLVGQELQVWAFNSSGVPSLQSRINLTPTALSASLLVSSSVKYKFCVAGKNFVTNTFGTYGCSDNTTITSR